jgi:F420-dependent oxidoreductase-like protein
MRRPGSGFTAPIVILAVGIGAAPGAGAVAGEATEVASPARGVRFGIQIPQQECAWDDVRRAVLEAERLGFDSAWVYDHFTPIWGSADGPALEGWSLLSALSVLTTRIRLGVMVTGNTYRNPALLAKIATTVDHLSGGRLILGMGAGWFEKEHRAYGFHYGTAKERAERLEESLQVIKKLWTEKRPDFEGKYYRLEQAPFSPMPVQEPHPPIVIGGQGKKWIVPLVGRYADGWNAVTGVSPEGVRERIEIIRQECAVAGRERCPTQVSVLLPLFTITRIPLAGPAVRLGARFRVEADVAKALLVGSAEGITKQIREYVDAGANEIIISLLPPFKSKLIRRIASDIIPAFAGPAAATAN